MNEMKLYPIGKIENNEETIRIILDKKYREGLKGLDGMQVLDLKPYTPSIDRIEKLGTPDWCSHWPKSYEESGDFAWSAEFNF